MVILSNNKSAQVSIASLTGTLVYSDTTSKLTSISLSFNLWFFKSLEMSLVEQFILHSGTNDSQSAICLEILSYGYPGIATTGLSGQSVLCTLASPYNRGG